MATFLFQAKMANGKMVKGEVDANSETEAKVKIRSQRMIPLKVVLKTTVNQREKAAPKGGLFSKMQETVKPKELQVFTRQFAVLIGAGVPIVQSLDAMIGGGRSTALNNAIRGLLDDVERGRRLADGMKKYPLVFDRMYVNLVKAGEEGGVLEVVLNRLAEYVEKSVKLKSKIVGAMWYPAAIVVVAAIVITAILVFVIPQFVEMFEQMGQELPALTQWVINASEWIQEYWFVMIGIIVAIPTGVKLYYATPDGRRVIDRILIESPIFGQLVQKGSIARFSRTLGTLIAAGVRIIDSLDIAAATAGNYCVEQVLKEAKDSISKGRTMSEPLKKSKDIPDMVGQMISIGEQTGNMDTMLGKIADFYEDEVETAAAAMTTVIEPILMVFLGGIIAVLVIAMYLPIFNLAGAVGG